jgi:hypothetical protein
MFITLAGRTTEEIVALTQMNSGIVYTLSPKEILESRLNELN